MAGRKIYVAKDAFVVDLDGGSYTISKGTRVREGHEILKGGRLDLFEEQSDQVDYDIETATAAPGEKRGEPLVKVAPAKR